MYTALRKQVSREGMNLTSNVFSHLVSGFTFCVSFLSLTYFVPYQSFSEVSVCVCALNCVPFFATPWTVALQAPLPMEFLRQEYWSGLPLPSAGDFLDPGIEPGLPALQANSLPPEPPGKPNPGIKPRSRTLQAHSLPAEPQGSPRSTCIGILCETVTFD